MKTTLYLGLEPPAVEGTGKLVHMPVICTVPRPASDPSIINFYRDLPRCTHGVFTSKTAVRVFFQYLPFFGYHLPDLAQMTLAAVGQATAAELKHFGASAPIVAAEETAEGLCRALEAEVSPRHIFFWPHSALSRSVIPDFFLSHHCKFLDCVFYETHYVQPEFVPALDGIDEIVFTSPSTVEGFIRIYGAIPWEKRLVALGPVTERQLFLLRE